MNDPKGPEGLEETRKAYEYTLERIGQVWLLTSCIGLLIDREAAKRALSMALTMIKHVAGVADTICTLCWALCKILVC